MLYSNTWKTSSSKSKSRRSSTLVGLLSHVMHLHHSERLASILEGCRLDGESGAYDLQYDECTSDKLISFRILALTGEKIEKAVDFQSREHETQVSEYMGCLSCMRYTQQFLVPLALPRGCTRVPFAHIYISPLPKKKVLYETPIIAVVSVQTVHSEKPSYNPLPCIYHNGCNTQYQFHLEEHEQNLDTFIATLETTITALKVNHKTESITKKVSSFFLTIFIFDIQDQKVKLEQTV